MSAQPKDAVPFTAEEKRFRITLIFGAPEIDKAAKRAVIRNLSRKYGGCTVINSKGYWSEQGDQFTDNYDRIANEHGFILTVSVMEYEPDVIRKACEPMKKSGCEWIHCEIETVFAKHFQI